MSDYLVYTVVMEKFLQRENIAFQKRVSASTNSVYLRLQGRRHPFTLRISDHRAREIQGETGWARMPDFNIQSYDDLKRVQTSISKLVKSR